MVSPSLNVVRGNVNFATFTPFFSISNTPAFDLALKPRCNTISIISREERTLYRSLVGVGDGVRGTSRRKEGSNAEEGTLPRDPRRLSKKDINSSCDDSIGLSEYVLDRRAGALKAGGFSPSFSVDVFASSRRRITGDFRSYLG